MIHGSTLFVLLAFLSTSASARIFTDAHGTQFEATVVGLNKDTVLLQSASGIKKVSVTSLSANDQKWLASYSPPQHHSAPRATVPKRSIPPKSTTAALSNIRSISSAHLQQKFRLTDNYAQRWPSSTHVSASYVKIIKENKSERQFIYHTPHYELISDIKLTSTITAKFALQFEATREFIRQLPISPILARIPSDHHRYRIFFFSTKADYVRAGGIPQSAGVYRHATNDVLIPLDSLGVTLTGNGLNYDPTTSNHTVTHELIHQLTDTELFSPGSVGWLTEGLADYCAATPYQSGRFTLTTNQFNIHSFVTAFGRNKMGGRNLGTTIQAPDLKIFMLQSYASFTAQPNQNYGLGLLITYYFIHMDPERRSLTHFLQALRAGKTGEAALAALLRGRSFDQLEKDIQKSWKANGITIDFQ